MKGTTPKLTPKQKEVLEFILSFNEENGYAPSQQEIARNFGFKSLGTVQNYLVRLERQGALRKTWNAKRSMEVVQPPKPTHLDAGTVSLPLLGRIAAGHPIEAIENQNAYEVPVSLLSTGGEHFVLKVAGDSMIEDGILNGDFVIIRKQSTANNGQIVVAVVGNEATLKRFYRRHGGRVELHPANPAYEPIVIESMVENSQAAHVPDFGLQGVLVGVIRRVE